MTSEEVTAGFEAELTENQIALLNKLAGKVVSLRMTLPAILFLETVRPLNYVGSQVMVFFQPLVRGFFGLPEWDELRIILEKRESIGYFLDLIEKKEGDSLIEEKKEREARKAQRKKRKNKSRFSMFLKSRKKGRDE